MTPDPERLVDLEVKFSFLEETLDALNEVILEHGRTLERLDQRVQRIERRISAASGGEDHADAPPGPAAADDSAAPSSPSPPGG